jgi:hypothetical protein
LLPHTSPHALPCDDPVRCCLAAGARSSRGSPRPAAGAASLDEHFSSYWPSLLSQYRLLLLSATVKWAMNANAASQPTQPRRERTKKVAIAPTGAFQHFIDADQFVDWRPKKGQIQAVSE